MVMIVSITLTFLSYSQTEREREREKAESFAELVSCDIKVARKFASGTLKFRYYVICD